MSRYNIVKMDKEISNKELDSYKNFDALLDTYKKSRFYKRLIVATFVSVFIVAGLANLMYFFTSDENQPLPNKIQLDNLQNESEMKEMAISSMDTISNINDDKLRKIAVEKGNAKNDVAKGKMNDTSQETVPKENDANEIVIQQETSFKKAYPEYGLDSLFRYFHFNIKNNTTTEIKGNLIVAFTIDAAGASGSIKIIQSLSDEIDDEIMRLVSDMPKWRPAIMNGKPVSSTCTLPIEISTHPIK